MAEGASDFVKKLGKIGVSAAVAAIAIYAAIKPEYEAEKALLAVQASHEELKQKVIEVQQAQGETSKHVEEGLAEIKSLRSFVDGYLEGLKAAGKVPASRVPAPSAMVPRTEPKPEPPPKPEKPKKAQKKLKPPKELKELYLEQKQLEQKPQF